MIDHVLKQLESDETTAINGLKEFLAIPSVSTDPAFAEHVGQAAQWVANRLSAIGFDVQIHRTKGHPIVIATSSDRNVANPSAPRILFYGHYDVVPADPIDKWESPPFDPTIRDGALFARGASDDKGQVSCFIEALSAWMQAHGQIPGPVTLIIEGEEECGSANLPAFVASHKKELTADVVVVSDTNLWETPGEKTVAITYGLRGLLYYDVQLHGPNHDLHSGMYGGIIANPATTLTQCLGQLFDEQHRVTIPGFYDDVVALTDDERCRWKGLQFDENMFLDAIGIKSGFGERSYELLERRWTRPSCDINGLYGGYSGAGAKTIIPSFAGAKISFRLAPNQDPRKIANSFEKWLTHHDVHGCTWTLKNHGQADPYLVSTQCRFITAAKHAIKKSTGTYPVLVREGATLPIIPEFKNQLGLDSLLIGFGRLNDQIHAPNEKFDLDCFQLGCSTHATLLAEFAEMPLE